MPRLMVPSSGGGRKLMRKLLAVVVGSVAALGAALGEGDSCAFTPPRSSAIESAIPVLFVMSSEVETSLDVQMAMRRRNIERFLDFARNDKRSNVVPPIDVRKKIIAAFAVREKRFVHVASIELFPEAIEAEEMIGDAFGGVMFRGPGFHEEGPVARLGEQQLACELFQNAIGQLVVTGGMGAGDFRHAARGGMKMRIDPGVGLIEPDTEISLVAPTRGGWLDRLLGGVIR